MGQDHSRQKCPQEDINLCPSFYIGLAIAIIRGKRCFEGKILRFLWNPAEGVSAGGRESCEFYFGKAPWGNSAEKVPVKRGIPPRWTQAGCPGREDPGRNTQSAQSLHPLNQN